ncbi:MAG: LCP family protein [Clostridium sp.]
MSRKNSKNSKKRTRKKVLIAVLSVTLVAILGVAIWAYSLVGQIKTNPISKNNVDLGIKELPPEEENKDIINIALFGADKRPGETTYRSDAMIVLTIDNLHKKIKMSSLMRDSHVQADGFGSIKLTEAYAYGGPELAIKTINQTFGLNIKDYATVNFESMEDLVNELGGVEVEVTAEELPHLNDYGMEQAGFRGVSYKPLTRAGKQLLDGNKAVAYTRIRYTSSGDFARTDRNRTILAILANKILDAGVTKFPGIVSKLAPYVQTSMGSAEILKLATSSFLSGTTSELVQQRFPTLPQSQELNLNIGSCIGFDKQITQKQIRDFIYNDIIPEGNPLNLDNKTDLFKEKPKTDSTDGTDSTTNKGTNSTTNSTKKSGGL